MHLQVFEWTFSNRYAPFGTEDSWRTEIEKLRRSKVGRDVEFRRPTFDYDHRTAKGGSYLQPDDPRAIRLFSRAPMHMLNTKDAIGFRVAKTLRPAFDHAKAAMDLAYVWKYFGGSRQPNYADHVGAERYDLSEDGSRILGYHAFSFVPVSHLAEKTKPRIPQLKETSREDPLVLGTLAINDPLNHPELDRGYYTICYRAGGLPEKLKAALKRAQVDLSKPKIDPKELAKKPWRVQLKKYGISDEVAKAEGTTIKTITLKPGGYEFAALEDLYLVRDADGNFVSHFIAKAQPEAESRYRNGSAELKIESSDDGETFLFDIGVPQYKDSRGRVVRFKIPFMLAPELAGGETWRSTAP